MEPVPENFWADIGELATDVPAEANERAISYLDIREATGVVQPANRGITLERQVLRFLQFEGDGGALRDSHGHLVQHLADRLDVGEAKLFMQLKRMRDDGKIDLTEAGIDRVYSIRLRRPRTPQVVEHTERVAAEVPESSGLADKFGVSERGQVADTDIARELAELIWLKFEEAIQEVGRLSQRVEELQQENQVLARLVQSQGPHVTRT